jgi:hypothetical protein
VRWWSRDNILIKLDFGDFVFDWFFGGKFGVFVFVGSGPGM